MNPTSEVIEYARTTIKLSARKLIGKCGITQADLDDVESEMMLDVLQRLPKHDGKRWSYKTFIPHVVTNKSHHILRNRCAEKEFQFRHAQSMDAPCKKVTDARDESVTLHDIVSAELLSGASAMTCREREELRIEITSVISKLDDVQRQCCQQILSGEPISRVAKNHGFSRSTYYKHVIVPIREAFGRAGLEEYIG